MVVINRRSVLSGILVQEAMRRQVVSLSLEASIKKGINALIKYKVNAVLVTDQGGQPQGVVTGTDLMSAFYAGLPLDMELGNILSSPPLSCFPDDDLESGLDLMKGHNVHQVYVLGEQPRRIVGFLAYSDIVGLLYRTCWACKRSLHKSRDDQKDDGGTRPLRVEEVMTRGVASTRTDQSLDQVIETLSENRFGAVLVHNDESAAAGVISKTDLVLAYGHGLSLETPGAEIMSSPVLTCHRSDPLTAALQKMLLRDTKRIFISHEDPSGIVGLVSLSDAARFRSGSCLACTAGRLIA
jgi:CBS domain-containing protein